MRVVITRSNPISPDSRVEKEADALNKAGHEVMILAWDRSSKYKTKKEKLIITSGEIDIFRMGEPAGFGSGFKKNLVPMIKIQIKFFLWLLFHNKKYDAIHACDFENAVIGLLCAKILKKKIVYDIFDYYVASHNLPYKLKDIVELIDNKLINWVDCVIICSEKRMEQIEGTQPKMLEIIHNSPSKAHMSKGNTSIQVKSNGKLTRIAYVGILSKNRLLKELINCIANRDDCELHIGGFGQLENYVSESARKHNNIHYYGRIQYHETLQLEEKCDILTAIYDPSIANHRFAAPNKFYEALLLGKPIIIAENTGMEKDVKDYDLGVIISYNEDSLNKGITNLISRKGDWEDIATRMQIIYKEKYSWDIMESRLQNIYNIIEKAVK